jgi:hypothetical protein
MVFQDQPGSVPILIVGSGATLPLITLKVAQGHLSDPSSLAPRPSSVNIWGLILWLNQILTAVPSYQLWKHGYSGLILQPKVYALWSPTVWVDTPNPGVHRPIGGIATKQRDSQVVYNSLQIIFDSKQNGRQAICDALNKAISTAYKRV